MKVRYRSPGGRIEIEMDVATELDLVATMGRLQDLFETGPCGMCKSIRIKHDKRNGGGHTYYEVKCTDCGARLPLHQNDGVETLYRVRRGPNGQKLPNDGWEMPPAKTKERGR